MQATQQRPDALDTETRQGGGFDRARHHPRHFHVRLAPTRPRDRLPFLRSSGRRPSRHFGPDLHAEHWPPSATGRAPSLPVRPRGIPQAARGGRRAGDATLKLGDGWLQEMASGKFRTWEDLAFLRENWDGPVVVKGVQTVEDAHAAMDARMDGIVVFNHGTFLTADNGLRTYDILRAAGRSTADRRRDFGVLCVGEDHCIVYSSPCAERRNVHGALRLGDPSGK